MDTRSTNQNQSDENVFPPNMIELMKIMDDLTVGEKDKDECLPICFMLLNPDESDEESLNNENAPFEEVFNMPLIDEALEFAKKKAHTVKEISDFIWDKLPEIVITDDE